MIAFDRSDYGPPGDTPSGASDVFVASADGRDLRRLTRTPYNETVLGWLSNPLRIVYASHGKPTGPTDLYALNLKGGAPVVLGQVRAADQLLALSHDARRALVATPRLEPKRYALVDLVRKTRRPLPGIADFWWADGAWSRDDSMLAYATDESIVILRRGRVLRRVELGGYSYRLGGLAWSPDGKQLAYGEGGIADSSLWLVRVEDGSRTQLTGGEDNDLDPVWSPDGSTIYYERGSFGDDDGLRATAPDGTGDRKITNDDWAGGGLFNLEGKNDRWLDTARISPDGTKIAYLLGQRGAWKNWSLVGVMNADGSDKTPFPASEEDSRRSLGGGQPADLTIQSKVAMKTAIDRTETASAITPRSLLGLGVRDERGRPTSIPSSATIAPLAAKSTREHERPERHPGILVPEEGVPEPRCDVAEQCQDGRDRPLPARPQRGELI